MIKKNDTLYYGIIPRTDIAHTMFKLQLDLLKKKKLEKFKCYAEITILREKKGREREIFFFP